MGGVVSSATTPKPTDFPQTYSGSPVSTRPSPSSHKPNSSSYSSMSSSESKTPESGSQHPVTLVTESPNDAKILEEEKPRRDSNEPNNVPENREGGENYGEDEEEEGECGFCLFMKGGGCKDHFVAWEKCIEEAEKNEEDIVEKCFEITGSLKKCMEAHSDYYEPILRAEKVAEEEAVKELEKEKEAASQGSDQIGDSKESEVNEVSLKDTEQQGGSIHR